MSFVPFWKRIKDNIEGLDYHPLALLDLPQTDWPNKCWIWTGAKNNIQGYVLRQRFTQDEIKLDSVTVKPVPVVHNPASKRTEAVHRLLFQALVRELQPNEFLRKNEDLCINSLCVYPAHWLVVRRKPKDEVQKPARRLGMIPAVNEPPTTEIMELCDLIEREFGIDEPKSFDDLRQRPTMMDWTDQEITIAIKLLGGYIEGKLL